MIKKINIFLVLLLLLLSIGVVSAADDADGAIISSDETTLDIAASVSDDGGLSVDVVDNELLTSNIHIVNSSTYSTYFTSKGNLIPSSVNEGDTLQLEGEFNRKNFTFSKPVNVVGAENNRIKNGVLNFQQGASGSTVSNLNIANTNSYLYGIFINGASNCTIQGCVIYNTGQSSYGICVGNNATYNNIINNEITTYGQTYGHGTRSTPPVLLCNSHYNYIANNNINCDDANGIYMSSYGGGPLDGGESTFNTIHNNTIKYNVLPTSWAYGVQVMGKNNTISSNRIIGAYRGISTSNSGNVIIDNWIINSTGADYNNPGVPSGAELGIVGSYNSIIKNNHIVNAKIMATGAGISALDNSVIENNYVEVSLPGKGIHPQGNNILIKNNTIITDSGSGILYNTYSHDLKVLENNITSVSGVGVLIQKVSKEKMPSNITIVGNAIATGNKYAIDAAEADANSTNVIGPNYIPKGKGEVRTPEGSYDPSKPSYIFNGTVYNITPENVGDYINANGGLSSDIKDGDILNFTGEFYLGVIYVNSAIKITGDNPVFYNTTFRVQCDGVWIENLIIRNAKAERLNAWGVLVYNVCGATVTNCDIYVDDPNAAYAIYVVEASDVDVINNNLSSSGNYLTYTLLAYETEDCNFINNIIYTWGTGVVHKFESQHCLDGDTNCLDGDTNCLDGDTNCLDGDTNCLDGDTNCLDGSSIANGNHMLSEVYRTYGILMAYSSGCNVSGNRVNVTSKLNQTVSTYNSTNSIVGIDSYFDTHDNIFSGNDVYIKAYDNYIYGMGVLGYTTGHDAPEGHGASNNQFINNYIVIEGTYCVEGIIVGHESVDTIIEDNIIDLKSDNVAYGITLEMSQKSTITNNYLTLNSDAIYGMEAYSSNNNTIIGNELELNAKQIYGLLFFNANNNSVTGNRILANGTGDDINFNNFDSIGAGNTGIYLKSISTNNVIKMNTVTSTKGYAVLVDNKAIDNVISDNYLYSEMGVGNAAVNNTRGNVVEDNYIYTFSGKLDNVYNVKYLETAKINLKNIADGALVKFYITDTKGNIIEYVGSTVSSNGAATFDYKLADSVTPGTYRIKAVASKENYQTKVFTASLLVVKGSLNVELNNVSAKVLTKAKFSATVSDSSGNPLSGVKVKFYRTQQNKDVYIGEATTVDGVANLLSEIPSLSDDTYVISAKVDKSSNFNEAIGKATLFINDKKNLNIFFSNVLTNPGSVVPLTATVNDNSSNGVSGIDVKFYIRQNGVDVLIDHSATDDMGIAKVNYAVPSTFDGSCFISAKVDGSDDYNPAIAQAILKTYKNSVDLAVDNVSGYVSSETTFTAAVKDSQNHMVSGLEVEFYVIQNGKNIFMGKATSGIEGVAELITTLPSMAVGEYVISANVVENNEYYAESNQATLSVEKCNTSFSLNDVSVVYNGDSELFVTLINDVTGNPISGANVVANIGGTKYSAKTNSEGQVRFSTNGLAPGSYTATVSYKGNSKYAPASATANITVGKAPTGIAADDIVIANSGGELVAVLTNAASGKGISNANVRFVINNQKYTVKTNSNGEAKLNITGLAPGNYSATVSYNGNSKYDASNETFNVVVNKVTTWVSIYYDNSTGELVATLINTETGKGISGAFVVFNLNGAKTSVKTDKQGQARFSIGDTDPNNFNAGISYGGNSKYLKSTSSIVIAEGKIPTVISNVYDRENGVVVATVTNTQTGKGISGANVVFNLNGTKTSVKTDKQGQAKFSVAQLDPNLWSVGSSYGGNSKYSKSTTAISIVKI